MMKNYKDINKVIKKHRYMIYGSRHPSVKYSPILNGFITGFVLLILGIIKLMIFENKAFASVSLICGIGILVLHLIESGAINKLNITIKAFAFAPDGIVIFRNGSKQKIHQDDLSDLHISEDESETQGLIFHISHLKSGEVFELMKFGKNEPKIEEALLSIADMAINVWNDE